MPALVIAHVAAHTETIRLGAGGVMLPNHSPYVVAEQLQAFTERAGADELMLLVKGSTTETNNRTLELVAESWGLDPATAARDPTTWRR